MILYVKSVTTVWSLMIDDDDNDDDSCVRNKIDVYQDTTKGSFLFIIKNFKS